MAKLSNINGKFAVEDTGAIRFSDQTGTTGQILKSNGNSAPTWVDPNTVGTGPWLPLAGGIVSGPTTFQSSLTVGGTLTVNGSGGSVFNSTAASNHIIAAYRASNGNNVATFRTTDSGYIFRIHAQNAGTIYIQNDDGSNYIKIPDSGSNEVSGNITFTGNLDIGPDALDIQIKAASNNSGNNLIYMRGNASNDKSSLQMNHFGYADYYIGVGHVGNGKFNIANDLTGNDFVIDTSGNVGIGATDPVKKLDVRGQLAISNSASSYWYMDRNDSTGNFEILTDTNSSVFNIDTSGNVGIGAPSPDFALDIEAVDGGVQLQMGRTNTNAGSTWMGSDSSGFHLGVGAYGAGNSAADPNGFTVLTSGNVGIGTASPTYRLEVKSTATNTALFTTSNTVTCNTYFGHTAISNNTNIILYSNAGNLQMWKSGTASSGWGGAKAFNIYNSDGAIAFHPSGNANAMFINTDSKVGIGTTGPATKLTVKGATQFGGNSTSTAALTSEFSAYGTTQNLYAITLQEGAVWSPGIAVINFAASRSGLQKHYAGQIIVRLTYYNGSGVSGQGGWSAPSAVGAVVAYSGQAETYIRVYVNGTNTGNPQTIQIGVRDIDDTTNYFVSDIRVTLRSGALTITS